MKHADQGRADLIASGEFDPGTDYLEAGVLLLAGLKCRHHLEDLHKATGIPKDKLRVWKRRLIANGIWTGETQGSKTHAWWFHEEHGWVAFILDAMVVLGTAERMPEDPEKYRPIEGR